MTIDFQPGRGDNNREPTRQLDIERIDGDSSTNQPDVVAVEQPLEIRLQYTLLDRRAERSLSVTMRTPGADRRLAAGFLYGEGIVSRLDDIDRVTDGSDADGPDGHNVVTVSVGPEVDVDVASVQRNFYTTSSCGVCGKGSLEALEVDQCSRLDTTDFTVGADVIRRLPDNLRGAQPLFDDTGGIHAAGLFNPDGELLELCEDVGRHNALDKLVGARLLAGRLPADETIAVLSGRASFELLQKALRARISVVVAVGAPSSLAVELARHFGITLVGFARKQRCNVYAHPERISTP